LPNLAADEVVNRLAAGLTDDVPQGSFDSSHRGEHDGAGVVLDLIKFEPEILDVKWTSPDYIASPVIENELPHRALLPAERAIAPTHQPGVGLDPHQNEIAPGGSQHEHFNFDYFHGCV